MAKGTYTVGEGGETSSRDASYKSCLCALLIFISICLLILVGGIKWSSDKLEKELEEEAELLGLKGDLQSTSQRILYTTTKGIAKPTTRKTKSVVLDDGITTTSTKTTGENEVLWSEKQSTATTSTTSSARTSTGTTTAPPLLIPQTERNEEIITTSTVITPVATLTQTELVDQTTTPYQESSNYTTTSKMLKYIATSIPNENEIQKSNATQHFVSTTTYDPEENNKLLDEDLGNDINTSTATSGETTDASDKGTQTFTTAFDYQETGTTIKNTKKTKLASINEATQVSSTTEGTIDYRMLEVVEVTNDDTTEEPSTGITETDAPPSSVMQDIIEKSTTFTATHDQTVLRKILYAVTESTTKPSTTTEAKLVVIEDGQRVMEEYDYFESVFDHKTTSSTQTTKKNEITDGMQSLPKKTSTTTNSPLLFRKPEPVCLTVGCKSAASRMLSLMNHSEDPCENFYEFACGGMQVDNADSDTWKRLSEQLYLINNTAPSYLQTFKIFYDSCVSHEYEFDYEKRIAGVLELVKEVGEILDGEPLTRTIDMTDLFAKLILRQSLPVMDIDVDIDKQSSMFILKLTLPRATSVLKESGRWSALTEAQKRCLDEQRHELQQPNLDLTKIYDSYLTCQKNHAIYLNSIQTVVRALGFYSHLKDTYNRTQRIQDLRTTIEWDILDHLNSLPPPKEVKKQILFKDYTIQKISDLQVHYPFLQWKKLFKALTRHELEDSTLVQVYFQPYFKSLFEGLQRIPKWKVNNALVAMYAHNLYENLVIPQAKHSRENYCLKLSSNLFRDVSSNLYMKTWTKTKMEESQQFLTKIFDLLKQNLTSAVQEEEWLDDASRTPMLLKLNKMSLTFNKQEDLYNNETALNLKYNAVNLKPVDFQYNAVKMLEIESNMRYVLAGKPCSINYLWGYFVNAYDSVPTSFYSKVLIMAPLGMVKQPVKGFPGYITMARIGLSLAREIGRHFDPVGIQYGMTLSTASEPSYKAMQTVMENESLLNVTRFVGQQATSFTVDPKLSVNERIADNTGLRLISESFNSLDDEALLPWVSTSFSREKIFFITVAQEYCQKVDMPEFMQQLFETEILPAPLRVENIMTNSENFSEVFQCPEGSAMNDNPTKNQFPHLAKAEYDYNYNYNLNN